MATQHRGQAVQIGAVLIFGIIVILLSTYQAYVVPNQNQEIEFNHNQEVQKDMEELRNAIVSANTGSGTTRSVSISLGTTYPSRALFVNPTAPSGSLRTDGTAAPGVSVSIDNASAADDAGDIWNGTERSYSTGRIVYRPNYNEYVLPPETVYENGVVYNRFRDANVTTTDQQLIDGDTINLVALNGSVQASQSGTASVDVRSISSSDNSVAVTNVSTGSPVTITIPTRLTAGEWETLLEEERTSGNVASVSAAGQVTVDGEQWQLVEIELEQDTTYTLRMSRVGIGSNVERSLDEAYLQRISGNGTTVPEGSSTTLVVEARDEYNNPASGQLVQASTKLGGSNVTSIAETDSDGQVELTYEAPSNIDGSAKTDRVNVSLDVSPSSVGTSFDTTAPKNVTFTVTADNTDGSGTGGGGGGAYTVEWKDPSSEPGTESCDSSTCTFNYSNADSLDLTMSTTPVADGAGVEYAVGDQSIGSVSPTSGTTDNNGEDTTTFTPCNNGNLNVYTSSGSGGDRLDLSVTNYGGLTLDPNTENDASVHNWTFDDVCFSDRVDEIEVDYPASTSFDGLDESDITVYMESTVGQAEDISVNNDSYSGSSATFDLSGAYNTTIDGLVYVKIDGVENPDAGDYTANLTFRNTTNSEEIGFEKSFSTVTATPQGTVDVQDSINAGASDFTVDYTFDFTAGGDAYLVVENLDTGGTRDGTVTSDGQWTVTSGDVGGLNNGDTVEAKLYESTSQTNQLATDSTTVQDAQLSNVGVTDILPDADEQMQTFSFTITDTALSSGDNVEIDLDEAQATSPKQVDYSSASVNNVDDGGAGGDTNFNTGSDTGTLTYQAPSGGTPAGTDVSIRLTSVSAGSSGDQSDPYTIPFSRTDTAADASTDFSVDAPSGTSELDSLSASDLVGTSSQEQTIKFTPTTDMVATGNGPEILAIDLSDAQSGNVDYSSASVKSVSTGSAGVNTDTGIAYVTYNADGGVSANTDVEIVLEGVNPSATGDTYQTGFSRGTADTDQTSFQVLEPAFFEMTIDNAPSEVTEGDSVTVEYTIENTGDVQGTQDIQFTVDDDGGSQIYSDTRNSVTVASGGTDSGSFTYTTQDGDEPSITVEVASDDDTASQSVTVKEALAFSYSSAPARGNTNDDVTFDIQNDGNSEVTIAEVEIRDQTDYSSFQSYEIEPPQAGTISDSGGFSTGTRISHTDYDIASSETATYRLNGFDNGNMNNEPFDLVIHTADGRSYDFAEVSVSS